MAAVTVGLVSTTAVAQPHATVIPGTSCPAFPADNVWNTPLTGLPVSADSATWLASMGASTTWLHPAYGPSGRKKRPYGIPWQIVTPSTRLVHVRFTDASQSDAGPFALSRSTPIEHGSDRHAIMVNPSTFTPTVQCTARAYLWPASPWHRRAARPCARPSSRP